MGYRGLSLGQQLYLGFGLVLLLVAGLFWAQYQMYQQEFQVTKQLTELIMPRVEAVSDIKVSFLKQSDALGNFVYSGDRDYLTDYQKSNDLAGLALGRLDALPRLPEGIPLHTKIRALAAQFEQAADKCVALRQEGRRADAEQALRGEVEPTLALLITRAKEYSDLQMAAKSEALRQIEEIQEVESRNSTLIALLLLACCLLVSLQTVRSISRPTKVLMQASRALARGDYQRGIGLVSTIGDAREPTKNEITELAGSFGSMASAILERERRLLAQARLSSVLASTINDVELARGALKEITEYTGAEFGLVYGYDDAERLLNCLGSHALDGEPASTLKLGEGIPGEAAASRRKIVVREIPADAPFRVHFGFDQLPPRTVAAFPMICQDQLVGALLLGSVRELPEIALGFAEAAAQQLGVSLQNAIAHRQLQALTEELEEKNETLASRNEELQAQTEEIQSQNEEIQSQNEELQTQNEEIQSQSQELAERNRELAQLTERTSRLYAETQEKESLLRNVLAQIPEAVLVVDNKGGVVASNAAAEDMFGIASMESVPIATDNDEDAENSELAEIWQPIVQALYGKRVLAREIHYTSASTGSSSYAQISSVPIFDGGRVACAVTIATDISRLKEVERAKDEFLAIVSHELKTPVTPVYGYAQLLCKRMRQKTELEAERKMAESILEQANRVIRLVDRLLNLSRAQLGRMELRHEPVDLVTMVRDLVEVSKVQTSDHTLVADTSGEIIGCWDRGYLEEMVNNLLDNAIRYSPEGGEVRVSVTSDDGVARISVSDQGIGIPKETLPDVFKRHFRSKEAKLVKADGMGIGLYLCREIALAHGGRIWVDSEPGKGSTFTVELPLNGAEP